MKKIFKRLGDLWVMGMLVVMLAYAWHYIPEGARLFQIESWAWFIYASCLCIVTGTFVTRRAVRPLAPLVYSAMLGLVAMAFLVHGMFDDRDLQEAAHSPLARVMDTFGPAFGILLVVVLPALCSCWVLTTAFSKEGCSLSPP